MLCTYIFSDALFIPDRHDERLYRNASNCLDSLLMIKIIVSSVSELENKLILLAVILI